MHWGNIISASGVAQCFGGISPVYWEDTIIALRDIISALGDIIICVGDIVSALGVFHKKIDN